MDPAHLGLGGLRVSGVGEWARWQTLALTISGTWGPGWKSGAPLGSATWGTPRSSHSPHFPSTRDPLPHLVPRELLGVKAQVPQPPFRRHSQKSMALGRVAPPSLVIGSLESQFLPHRGGSPEVASNFLGSGSLPACSTRDRREKVTRVGSPGRARQESDLLRAPPLTPIFWPTPRPRNDLKTLGETGLRFKKSRHVQRGNFAKVLLFNAP